MNTDQFKEGIHFTVLNQSTSQKLGIDYFFSFFQPHCYSFFPTFKAIRQQLPDGVRVKANHVSFLGGVMGKPMTQAYVTMCNLGLEDKMTTAMFDRLMVQRQSVRGEADIRQICLSLGVDEIGYDSTYNSFMVISILTQLDRECVNSGIKGVPTLLINGKYQVNFAAISSQDLFISLVNYLLAKQ